MRDYNSIQFRSPNSTTSIPTAAATSTTPQKSQTLPTAAPAQPDTSSTVSSHTSANTTPTTVSMSRTSSPFRNQSSSSPIRDSKSPLAPADALAVRRDGPDAVILKLREQLQSSVASADTAKSAVAKSDAVVLELRSSVRQLKRQLEKATMSSSSQGGGPASSSVNSTHSVAHDNAAVGELQVELDRAHAQILTADMVRKELEDTLEAEQYTWELRVQDQERALDELQQHCDEIQQQLDERRKSYETNESSWTRELQQLQDQVKEANEESAHCKAMAKAGMNRDASIEDGGAVFHEKILLLEQERTELQGCLDEALKELEAVDAELQNDGTAILREENERLQALLERQQQEQSKQQRAHFEQFEQLKQQPPKEDMLKPLQQLHQWLLDRDHQSKNGEDVKKEIVHPTTSKDVFHAIRTHVEKNYSHPDNSAILKELESQISVYKGDLKARADSSAELRSSLREAVALLKPLQDAVAKADREKAKLTDQLEKSKATAETSFSDVKSYRSRLNEKEDEIDELRQEIESLQLQLSKAKLAAANGMVSNNSRLVDQSPSVDDSTTARDELRAKRQSEKTLKGLLRDAQSRFSSLHQQNQQVEAMNSELQGRLRQVAETEQDKSAETPDKSMGDVELLQRTIEANKVRINELEVETVTLRDELGKKDKELQTLQADLKEARSAVQSLEKSGDQEKIGKAENWVRELEQELADKRRALGVKKETERTLSKSLKDALGLIKPLQMHLEEAEREKKELSIELMVLRQQGGETSVDLSRSRVQDDPEALMALENTVRELENENSQLQDALEDMSQTLNASHLSTGLNQSDVQSSQSYKVEARLREELVELQSRYEVTQSRLDDAFVENHSLTETMQSREKDDGNLMDQLKSLRGELAASEAELNNAKYIATAALVKVEELTISHEQHLTLTNTGSELSQEELFKQKEREVNHELSSVRRQHRAKVAYRLA